MSSRALRRLRQEEEEKERLRALKEGEEEDDDSSYEDESSEEETNRNNTAFQAAGANLLLMEDSSESESESEDEDDDSSTGPNSVVETEKVEANDNIIKKDPQQQKKIPTTKSKKTRKNNLGDDNLVDQDEDEDEEDLDEILKEFGTAAAGMTTAVATAGNVSNTQTQNDSCAAFLLQHLVVKHLDLDYTLREMLGSHAVEHANLPIPELGHLFHAGGRGAGGDNNAISSSSLAKRRCYLFGKPRPHWTRPPTLAGGGVGMKLMFEHFFEEEQDDRKQSAASSSRSSNEDKEEDGSSIEENESVNCNSDMLVPPPPYSTLILDMEEEKIHGATSSSAGTFSDSNATWFTFRYSDTYENVISEFRRDIEPTGDANGLAMFVANHPYCVDALLQLAMIFFHMGEMEKGNELLRRALFVYETATITNFVEGIRQNSITTTKDNKDNNKTTTTTGYHLIPHMDASRQENQQFFICLFRLIQISRRMGCLDTSFALSLLTLALDPFRDMMGMLCGFLDCFALKTSNYQFIVSLIESKKTFVYHMDEEALEYTCDLLDMPNWAFSYAMALKHLEDSGIEPEVRAKRSRRNTNDQNDSDNDGKDKDGNNDDDEVSKEHTTADNALTRALVRFPQVLLKLIEANNVNLTGRSFDMDWPPVVEYFREAITKGMSENDDRDSSDIDDGIQLSMTIEHISKIFVMMSHKLWSPLSIMSWLYKCASSIKRRDILNRILSNTQMIAANPAENDEKPTADVQVEVEEEFALKIEQMDSCRQRPHPKALVQYLKCKLEDYEENFQRLPMDVNLLDEALVVPALAIDPRGRRQFALHNHQNNRGGRGRRGHRGRGGAGGNRGNNNDDDDDDDPMDIHRLLMGQLGLHRDGRHEDMIDALRVNPEDPIMQVFLQSFLPWARVDGVDDAR